MIIRSYKPVEEIENELADIWKMSSSTSSNLFIPQGAI